MSRRLGILILVAFVAVAGRVVCPRGVSTCLVMQEASHDCCAGASWRAPADCCCKGTQRVAEAADLHALQLRTTAMAASVFTIDADPGCHRSFALRVDLMGGLGPPDTPTNRHTTLLL